MCGVGILGSRRGRRSRVPDFGNVFVSLGMTLALIATETHQKRNKSPRLSETEAEAVEETLAIIDK